MSPSEQLTKLERRLNGIRARLNDTTLKKNLDALTETSNEVGKSWSGSYVGYQSRVYFDNFQPPPPGCHFSVEWGLHETFGHGSTVGPWAEQTRDGVIKAIHKIAGVKSLDDALISAARAKDGFEEVRTLAKSILSKVEKKYKGDKFFKEWVAKIDEPRNFSLQDVARHMIPAGHQYMTRDTIALQGGILLPPHMEVLAQIIAVKLPFTACEELGKTLHALAAHIEEYTEMPSPTEAEKTKIFIGHGRSLVWKELKDFISDRLKLPWDEFNRIPVAGISTDTRIHQMLDEAAFALIILTAEDEQKDNALHPRLNVVHEAGLFQGRLGFKKAIILLEDGCEEFSNISGLGQIRFPKGRIGAAFEEIRLVLEREGIILPP